MSLDQCGPMCVRGLLRCGSQTMALPADDSVSHTVRMRQLSARTNAMLQGHVSVALATGRRPPPRARARGFCVCARARAAPSCPGRHPCCGQTRAWLAWNACKPSRQAPRCRCTMPRTTWGRILNCTAKTTKTALAQMRGGPSCRAPRKRCARPWRTPSWPHGSHTPGLRFHRASVRQAIVPSATQALRQAMAHPIMATWPHP